MMKKRGVFMADKKNRTTIYQVAKEANVSLATVSRVINGKGNVNEETAKLVRDAIDKLGYIPSVLARGLATSYTTNIGIVLPSPNYVYINNIMAGMMDVCKIYGYSPLIFTFEDVEDAARAVDSVLASRVEGIVVFNSQLTSSDVAKFTKISLPVVIIGKDKLSIKNGLVDVDYVSELKRFINEEIRGGIKDIYFLKDPRKDWHMTNGYEEAIVSCVKNSKVDLHIIEISDSYNVIYDYFKEKFEKQKPNHELYIATRDSLGTAVVNAGLDLGYKVPIDYEVMGIISTKNSIMSRPQMSSINVDLYEVGSIAMRMLTKMLTSVVNKKEFIFTANYIKKDTTKF